MAGWAARLDASMGHPAARYAGTPRRKRSTWAQSVRGMLRGHFVARGTPRWRWRARRGRPRNTLSLVVRGRDARRAAARFPGGPWDLGGALDARAARAGSLPGRARRRVRRPTARSRVSAAASRGCVPRARPTRSRVMLTCGVDGMWSRQATSATSARRRGHRSPSSPGGLAFATRPRRQPVLRRTRHRLQPHGDVPISTRHRAVDGRLRGRLPRRATGADRSTRFDLASQRVGTWALGRAGRPHHRAESRMRRLEELCWRCGGLIIVRARRVSVLAKAGRRTRGSTACGSRWSRPCSIATISSRVAWTAPSTSPPTPRARSPLDPARSRGRARSRSPVRRRRTR
jgi:hypothetical protein